MHFAVAYGDMSPFATVAGIEYSLFTEADAAEMVRVLGEAFARRDPPAVAVGLTPAEFEAFVALYCAAAATQGLTIVARSGGEMAGALLTEDSSSPMPDGMENLSPKFQPIFDILGALDSAYRGGRVIRAGEAAHLFLVGVAEPFLGRGIGRQLVARCCANAVREGYRLAVTEATNLTSQHIFRQEGFVERVRGSYGEHRFEGRACFGSIVEHGGPMLMDRRLAT